MTERLIPDGNDARIEQEPGKPLFQITLMRHAKPFYKDIGHDLTEEGVEQAKAAGKWMKDSGYFDDSDVFLAHSPTVRAKGTLDFVVEAAGLQDLNKHSTKQLRRSDIHDMEALLTSMAEFAEVNNIDSHEAAAKHHYLHPLHKEGVIIEPHDKKKERLYRAFEHVTRWFDKNKYAGPKIPHILAVSHFELITHLINDTFGIDSFDSYNTPSFAEMVNIKVYPASKDTLKLSITFKDKKQEVIFNRKTRSIEKS